MAQTTKRRKFKAEIQQVLDILIHSLYTDREIFLRELISNASDALHRFKLESLKSQEVVDPQAELGIWISGDPEAGTLSIRDTGIGLTQEEMATYLGTIAHSGAKGFIEAMQELNKGDSQSTVDVIGQFGVGFYSVFMVADEVTVTSRSYEPQAEAGFWRSSGSGSFTIGPADKDTRGTVIDIKLKEDAKEFAQPYRLRQIIKEHSDFIAFPIYLEDTKDGKAETAQVNEQTALWRERPQDVAEESYKNFYQQLTFDFAEPLRTLHFRADMPIQFYALLFVPSRRDYKPIINPDDYGLRLYARKVLIQEDFKELLPPYLRFMEGVVDSEDLALNVSRETVQATPMIARIRKALLGRVLGEFETMAKDEPEAYLGFYREFGHFLKEGVASDPGSSERLVELLRFSSSQTETDELTSLAAYTERMKDDQKEIYYVLGDDLGVVSKSSHLEYFRKHDLEVLFLTDPIDNFLVMNVQTYGDKPLKNIDDAELELPEGEETKLETPMSEAFIGLVAKAKQVLGERVEDVKESKLLTDSAARLSNPAGGTTSFYRAQRLMGRETEVPKKVLELNPKSELIQNLSARLEADPNDPLLPVLLEQLFENELLMEGLHPNPAEMIPRIQQLMKEASATSG